MSSALKTKSNKGGKTIKAPRRNRGIYASKVRVIGEEGEQIGIMPAAQALDLAYQKGLDLVEIAPQANPPVCKIIDYGKYLYEIKKQQQKARKKQVVIKLHEIKFGVRTNDHDLDHKLRKIGEFLDEGDRVKTTVVFRGREMEHRDLGKIVLDKIAEKLEAIGTIEQAPKMEGKTLFMVFSPIKAAKKEKKLDEDKNQ